MSAFLGFLSFILFILLIVGLISPRTLLRNSHNPSRITILKYWIFSLVFMVICSVIFRDKGDNYRGESPNETKTDLNPIFTKAKEKSEIQKQKEQLERELASIDKGIDFSKYKDSVESLQMELVLFSAWAKIVKEASISDNKEVNNLGKKLQDKVVQLQLKEFPIMRKSYGKAVYQKLWEENIETEIFGINNATIQFTGGIFASNKAKQQTQETLNEVLNMFRFKRANYKWYQYDDNYTYYEINSPSDGDLVSFK